MSAVGFANGARRAGSAATGIWLSVNLAWGAPRPCIHRAAPCATRMEAFVEHLPGFQPARVSIRAVLSCRADAEVYGNAGIHNGEADDSTRCGRWLGATVTVRMSLDSAARSSRFQAKIGQAGFRLEPGNDGFGGVGDQAGHLDLVDAEPREPGLAPRPAGAPRAHAARPSEKWRPPRSADHKRAGNWGV